MPLMSIFRHLRCRCSMLFWWAAACLAAPFAAGATGICVQLEAEDYVAAGGAEVRILERAGASAGKTVSYWEEPGTWIDLVVDIPRTGTYLLAARYALAWPDTQRTLWLDGHELGVVTLNGSGSWDNFMESELGLPPLALTAGTHRIRLLNAASRGLSLDRLTLHTPDVYLGDRHLDEKAVSGLLESLGIPHDPLARESDLRIGGLAVGPTQDRSRSWIRLHDYLLVTPTGTPGHRLRLIRTPNFRIAAFPLQLGQPGVQYWISDGQALYLVILAEKPGRCTLPGPLLCRGNIRPVQVCVGDQAPFNLGRAAAALPGDVLRCQGLHVSTWPACRVEGIQEGHGPLALLGLEPVRSGAVWLAAARYGIRHEPDRPQISVTLGAGGSARIEESVRRFATLAAFYDEGMFTVSVSGSGKAVFRDVGAGVDMHLDPGDAPAAQAGSR